MSVKQSTTSVSIISLFTCRLSTQTFFMVQVQHGASGWSQCASKHRDLALFSTWTHILETLYNFNLMVNALSQYELPDSFLKCLYFSHSLPCGLIIIIKKNNITTDSLQFSSKSHLVLLQVTPVFTQIMDKCIKPWPGYGYLTWIYICVGLHSKQASLCSNSTFNSKPFMGSFKKSAPC